MTIHNGVSGDENLVNRRKIGEDWGVEWSQECEKRGTK